MTTKVMLVDDHQIAREGLVAMITAQNDMEVVAAVGDGRSAIKTAAQSKPDVIIMDITMADMNGIEATRQILETEPSIKIIALSMYSDRRFVTGMLKAGAVGYLLKDCAFKELKEAINTVMNQKIYLSGQIKDIVVNDYINQISLQEDTAISKLTIREREVLQLLAEGKSTRNIAAMLNVSVKTVDTHRFQLMTKLNVKSIAELTKLAIREGLTSLV